MKSTSDLEREIEKDYVIAEYNNSVSAYFNGVDIGYTGLKSFITFNALLIAIYSIPVGIESQERIDYEALIRIVPFLGVSISVLVICVAPHYFLHLENCRSRCAELEQKFDGRLFINLGIIANNRRKIGSGFGICLIVIVILSVWLYLLGRNLNIIP